MREPRRRRRREDPHGTHGDSQGDRGVAVGRAKSVVGIPPLCPPGGASVSIGWPRPPPSHRLLGQDRRTDSETPERSPPPPTPDSMRVLFCYNEVEALGLEYLSAVVKQHGHVTGLAFDPRLFDFFRHEYRNASLGRLFSFKKEFLKKVRDFEPDVIGFQVLSANYPWSLEMAAEIKKALPNIPIVFGGYHPTASYAPVLEHPQVDYVIKGRPSTPSSTSWKCWNRAMSIPTPRIS